MNIEGQYDKLSVPQKRRLTYFAIIKNWHAYWRFKYFCLKTYEEKRNQNLA